VRGEFYRIADTGKSDKASQLVEAVATPAPDLKCEVQLGPSNVPKSHIAM